MKYLGLIEEVAGHKNIDTAALLKTLGCFKELSKDKLTDINEDVMKKMMSQRKWHQETLHTKETLRDVSQTESTEDKVLEVDPNVERSMKIHHRLGKMLPLYQEASHSCQAFLSPSEIK